MYKLGSAVREEFMLLTGKKKTFLFMLGIFLLYTILFGALFLPNKVTGVPVGVCDLDGGSSKNLIHALEYASDIYIQDEVYDESSAEQMLANGEVYGVVVIPADFSRQIAIGRPTNIMLLVNNANTSLGGVVLSSVQEVVGTYNAEVIMQQQIAAGNSYRGASELAGGISLSPRVLYNSTSGYTDFFLPLLILHALQITVVFILGPDICKERYVVADLTRGRLLLRLLLYSLMETGMVLLALGMAWAVFVMQCHLSLELILIIFTFCGVITTLAAAVGIWLEQPAMCITATLLYIMPSILFTGALWPRTSMDGISLFISYIIPIGYAADVLRDLLERGDSSLLGLGVCGLTIMVLLFGTMLFYGCQRLVRRKTC